MLSDTVCDSSSWRNYWTDDAEKMRIPSGSDTASDFYRLSKLLIHPKTNLPMCTNRNLRAALFSGTLHVVQFRVITNREIKIMMLNKNGVNWYNYLKFSQLKSVPD